MGNALSEKELKLIDAYWRAANYLSVGQIYLFDNPLLKQPLKKEHIKPRLLGHWGTTPGLNFINAHLNRVIKQRDLNMIYVTGPGHGGPGLVANTYLEGTYTEIYPNVTRDEEGLKRLFTQFSFPGGIGSERQRADQARKRKRERKREREREPKRGEAVHCCSPAGSARHPNAVARYTSLRAAGKAAPELRG